MKTASRFFAVITLSAIVSLTGLAELTDAQPKSDQPALTGPLARLPSQPGPHLDKIKALPDNSWLELGAPAADPKWGRARGRSWTAKMPLAPELRGAFLFGEGIHGYTKPDGHYMDDLWFYDIQGHRWDLLLSRRRYQNPQAEDQRRRL